MGFLPVGDPRLRSTIDAVEAALSDERGLIFRYRGGDDFDAPEGTFLLCTFWLAHALALIGEVERARAVLLRASGYATELGLLAEQVDPETGALWGNFPQAFSHLGLVNAAQAPGRGGGGVAVGTQGGTYGGQGRVRTGDLSLFRRTLLPAELPGLGPVGPVAGAATPSELSRNRILPPARPRRDSNPRPPP